MSVSALDSWKPPAPEIHGEVYRGAVYRGARGSADIVLRECNAEQAELAELLQTQLGLSAVTAHILTLRGVSSVDEARAYLNPTLRHHLPNPGQIKNINEAADLLMKALAERSLVTIYADFDVDGLTSCSQLLMFLREIGAEVGYFIPNRFEDGYGVSRAALEGVARAGTKLLVTVDCGITNVSEIAYAKKMGMKCIVIDHHQPGEMLPPADVVVDPAQDGCSFREHRLAAAGLVWMLLIVLRGKLASLGAALPDEKRLRLPDPKDFLDLAALGTICDMVPLTGLNRVIAHRGIEALRVTTRPGLVALMEVAGVYGSPRFGAGHIGFGLGPRLNAAGRLADANEAVSLLTASCSIKAKSLAELLDRLNTQRREIEEGVRRACIAIVEKDQAKLEAPALAVFGKEFHQGVIGIAAQRLVEEFYRPAAVMAPGETGSATERTQVVKGSVRSIRGFHVAEVLQALQHLLITGGGHAEAGGFTLSLDKLENFEMGFIEEARRRLGSSQLRRQVHADMLVELSQIDFQLTTELGTLSPFGAGNPAPVLVSEGVNIDSVTVMGSKHLRVRLSDGRCSRNAVGWDMYKHPLLRKGQRVNIAYQVELNTYQGISNVQLSLKHVW